MCHTNFAINKNDKKVTYSKSEKEEIKKMVVDVHTLSIELFGKTQDVILAMKGIGDLNEELKKLRPMLKQMKTIIAGVGA